MAADVTFVIPGVALPSGQPSAHLDGTVKAAVRVGTRRGASDMVRVTARPGEDIVLLHIANGPTLYLHPDAAAELVRAQAGAPGAQSRGGGTAPAADGSIAVPAQLRWQALETSTATRGKLTDWLGDVALDAVEVVTGLFKEKAAQLVAAAVTKRLDGQVDPGVYRLATTPPPKLKGSGLKVEKVDAPEKRGDPILVLIHGTFVDTTSTFGKLWEQHRARVEALFKHYGGRVYALDHPTVATSPFGNALTLVKALPEGACLHLVTHSRGGLVAEALARICGGQGLTEPDRALFKGDAYRQHRADLDELAREVKARNISVARIVRVACPARGTLLASRRLDAYLSVLRWCLQLAHVPVVPELVEFLSEVARRRAEPTELPGLEAMMPGRPMAQWLTAPAEPIDGDLRVVAGDIEGDSVLSWCKTMLSDLFYWTDNDLVVQTRSMYGGTPRADGNATFVFERGGEVTHFNYFTNERTADLITRGLMLNDPGDFRQIGPLSWQGKDPSGTRAAFISRAAGNPADRPAVFILPGILGSHLKVDGKRIWLSLRFVNNLDRLKWDPKTAARVEADGPVGMSYDKLIDYLAESHQVIPFSFDWRRPIEREAERLADAVDAAIAVRSASGQPVRLVAHSMGGLVARTMQLVRPESWRRLMGHAGARLLMLGTPNGGSFAPMQVMSGDDTFGNLLTSFGSLFDGHKARQMIAEMPGLLQLQAGLVDGQHGLDTKAGWEQLAAADLDAVRKRCDEGTWWHNQEQQIEALKWGVPTDEVLQQAVQLRKQLDEQVEKKLGADTAKMLLVVGNASFTPTDVKITDAGVVYLDAPEAGDGRVTFDRACLSGVRTWRVDVAHGDLANAPDAFDAYLDLLTTGDTTRLPQAVPGASTRGARGEVRATGLIERRPARLQASAEPPAAEGDVLSLPEQREKTERKPGARLRVSVVNGNLKFIGQPLVLGHYRSLKLTGTEKVIDALLDGAMAEALRAGLYPSAIGTNQIFINTRRNSDDPFVLPRPEAAIVVGLDEEGSLRLSDLRDTVRQGVLAYAQRIGERGGGGSTTFELAATLVGSGGSNMSVGTAAQAITMGVLQANQRLGQVGWPRVGHLRLTELHLDRATEALQALRALSEDQAQNLVVDAQIETGIGGKVRPPDAGYRGAEYDFISVRQQWPHENAPIEFVLDTRRARSEVRGVAAQSKLVDEMVRTGATSTSRDLQIGKSLFQLLVPLEIEPFLSGSASLLVQLDAKTAAYPWELLDTRHDENERDDERPWAVRTSLLRKLRTETFREQPHDAGQSADILVIGEPQCPADRYPALPGARAEASAVAEVLGVKPILNENAVTIVNAVFAKPYRVLHVAGHGDIIVDDDGKRTGGVVLSNGTTFGPREIRMMRAVPELAFINCCHLGSFPQEPLQRVNRLGGQIPAFAANVAEELIRIGVRCVVAAGWAVDDEPASAFARIFYAELKRNRPFVEAVGKARAQIWEKYRQISNTWAAYQCYGDPYWTLTSQTDSGDVLQRAAEVASSRGLELRLHALAIAHAYEGRSVDDVRAEAEQLAHQYAARWGNEGAVASAFGGVFAEIEDFDRAVEWYSRALGAEDGGASLHALQQLGNVRARRAPKMTDRAAARKEATLAIELLQRAAAIASTVEGQCLLGSAYKRLAEIERKSGNQRQEQEAIANAVNQYAAGEHIARATSAENLYYPAMNRMSLALALDGDAAPAGFDSNYVGAVRQSLQKKVRENPDFWSVVGLTELRIYHALAQRGLAIALPGILADLDDLMPRATSSRMWASVADQAQFTLTRYIKLQSVDGSERVAAKTLLARFAAQATEAPKATKTSAKKVAGKSTKKTTARKRAAKRRTGKS